jgi:nascent polypeptide-associated complex subunit alpha
MFGGLDPKKMQAMMRQMGIKQEEIAALRVIIEKENGKIVIDNPQVTKILMQGNESWQITGDAREENGISQADIELVMEKTGVSEKKAQDALAKHDGDIAETILSLS